MTADNAVSVKLAEAIQDALNELAYPDPYLAPRLAKGLTEAGFVLVDKLVVEEIQACAEQLTQ